jgi:hypothetical protein
MQERDLGYFSHADIHDPHAGTGKVATPFGSPFPNDIPGPGEAQRSLLEPPRAQVEACPSLRLTALPVQSLRKQ